MGMLQPDKSQVPMCLFYIWTWGNIDKPFRVA